MDQIRELLAAHPFLHELSADEIGGLAGHATEVLFPADTRIFEEGEAADRFWLIREGQVRLETMVPGRGPVIVETLGSGAVIGWSWLYPPRRWHFGGQTTTATAALELDGPAVLELCQHRPSLGYKLMNAFLPVVIGRLQSTRIRLLDLYGAPA
jgi:CRP/FNR family cyclic AMP-dependent transcriptional regulator